MSALSSPELKPEALDVSAGEFGPRLELQRHVEVGERPRIISFGFVGFAGTVVGSGVLRIDLDPPGRAKT
jgi:hypothetical protein